MLSFKDFLDLSFESGPSKVHGHGVIIKKPVKSGTCLGTTHRKHPDGWRMLKPLGNYNHSSERENAIIVKSPTVRKIVVLRDMSPGDEILVNFRKQPDLEQPCPDWSE